MAIEAPEEEIVFFDEFAVYTNASTYYSWGLRNHRLEIKSQEKDRKRLNGLLGVNAHTGEEYLQTKPRAKSEDVADYLADYSQRAVERGITKVVIILDNNPTHKKKMRGILTERLQERRLEGMIELEWLYIPAYSPKLNLAEYVIHLLRQRYLHHRPPGWKLEEVQALMECGSRVEPKLSPEQTERTLKHIYSFAGNLKVGRE